MRENLIYTFYTKDTPYEQEAKELCYSFNTFNVAVKAIGYSNAGDWMKNALARSSMLEQIRCTFPTAVIGMLDADVRPVKAPELLWSWYGDVACEDRGHKTPANRRYSCGVLLFGPTTRGKQLLTMWAAMCRVDPKPKTELREQLYLYECIEQMKALRDNPLNVTNIGNNYNRKPEDVKQGDDTVLVHNVASRRHLKTIGGVR